MWTKDAEDNDQFWFREITGLNVRSEYIPLIVGLVTSTTLVVVLLFAYVLWRCCISTDKTDVLESTKIETIEKNLPKNLNYSTIFAGSKNGHNNSRIIEFVPEHEGSLRWFYKNHTFFCKPSDVGKQQQHSTPNPKSPGNCDIIRNKNYSFNRPRSRSRSIILSPVATLEEYSLPQISEFCVHPCIYTSNNLSEGELSPQNLNIRTRSLPSSVKHKKHSMVAADSTIGLYDKVNFSKKRKNRMRNNEAAIIALSKSHSQFLNKDTDNLVDNEAVIVYDERTAL